MSDQNYMQRQETFNEIFGGNRFDAYSNGTNNHNNGQRHTNHPPVDHFNLGVQYENGMCYFSIWSSLHLFCKLNPVY